MEDFYTTEQLAEKMGTTERYIADLCRAGKMKSYKIGKKIYVIHSELMEFIRQHPYPVKDKKK
jgi:excisionase family DNA binding protein